MISPPTFGMYAVCARVQDAAVISVPLLAEQDFALDVEGILAAIDARTRIVFVCSPNNPTGASVALADITRLAEASAGRALLVVDEAYAEFSDAPSALSLQARFPHIVVLRTLSKAFALAGARIGSLIGDPALVGVLRSIMAPYPLPTPCVAAALSALDATAVALARSRIALLRQERTRLARALRGMPQVIRVFDSDANFLLVRFRDGAVVYRSALDAGLVLRDPSRQPGLENCLRISVGTPQENERLLQVLGAVDVPATAEVAA
jgi:histidinol-phosphate aminotransferase